MGDRQMKETKLYTEKSNARRAARKAGLDPDKVTPTRDGRWRLPEPSLAPVAAPAPEPAEDKTTAPAARTSTPADELAKVLAETPPGEMPALPPFLDAKKRPATPRPSAPAATRQAKPVEERKDYRKPKSLSWEEWDRHLADAEKTKREKTAERINKLREDKGLPPVKTPRAKRAERKAANGAKREVGYKGHAAGSAAAEVHRVFDERGLDAAIEHGKTLRYNPSTVRRLAEKWGTANAS